MNTQSNTDLLAMLTREGVLINASVRYPRFHKKLNAADLGLDTSQLRLVRTTRHQVEAGARLRMSVEASLAGRVDGVAHIGSSSVTGLLAKPIVDLAIGTANEEQTRIVHSVLPGAGWRYRGDAGDDGGLVFVLEAGPAHRLAHAHVVDAGGQQWQDYLCLRDLLRRSPRSRARYEAVKLELLDRHGTDRVAYTLGKTAVVRELLSGAE